MSPWGSGRAVCSDGVAKLGLGLVVGALGLVGAWGAVRAEAQARAAGEVCELTTSAIAPADHERDLLDPKLKGVELLDLGTPEAAMVGRFLRLRGVLPLNEVLATASVEIYGDRMVVDVIGKARYFRDTDDKPTKQGRTGVMRVLVPIGAPDGVSDIGEPEILWQHSLADLNLRWRVSIGEWLGVMTDDAIGFRRIIPLAGGGIDRGVRVPHVLTSLTPTTEDGLLEKTYAWRELSNPWYFRKKPYMPISVGRRYKRPDGTEHHFYTESNIAFHIWQDKGFERGFFSHGCIRMRTDDLMELAAYVFGSSAPIPVVVRMPPMPDADHPHPTRTDVYWEILNYGTADKPRYLLEYGQLYKTGLGKTPLPDPNDLRALDFREKPVETRGWD